MVTRLPFSANFAAKTNGTRSEYSTNKISESKFLGWRSKLLAKIKFVIDRKQNTKKKKLFYS